MKIPSTQALGARRIFRIVGTYTKVSSGWEWSSRDSSERIWRHARWRASVGSAKRPPATHRFPRASGSRCSLAARSARWLVWRKKNSPS
jgi:hypothetical protein